MSVIENPYRITFTDESGIEKDYTASSDVKISYDNGALKVEADCTLLKNVKLYFSRERRKNSYIYADTWERAYGDLCLHRGNVDGAWYMIEYGGEYTFGIGVKTGPNAFCRWEYIGNNIIFTADIKNGSHGVMLHGRTLMVAELVTLEMQGSFDECAAEFCRKMCTKQKSLKKPVYGGNDWYCNYGNNSYEKILLHAKRIAECACGLDNLPYMVIDDGWELCHYDDGVPEHGYNGGPWEYPNRNFKDMRKLAEDLKTIGVIPGIWYRPLLTTEKLPEEYILRGDGRTKVLDISRECVLELVREDIRRFAKWGYGLIKHDFSTWDLFGKWGFEMKNEAVPKDCDFYDKYRTTAEIIKTFYNAIKYAAGDALVMGCNTVSHLAAGVFDLQRTGDDTSGREWERTKKMGINTLAMRMHQHNIFYGVDADCVGITNDVSWEKNKQWLDVLSKSGTPLFVSIAQDAYTEEVKKAITSAFAKASQQHLVSHAEDIEENTTPKIWHSVYGKDEYEW